MSLILGSTSISWLRLALEISSNLELPEMRMEIIFSCLRRVGRWHGRNAYFFLLLDHN